MRLMSHRDGDQSIIAFRALLSGTFWPETVALLAVSLTDEHHRGCTLYYSPVNIALAFWPVNHCKAL